MTKRIKYSNIGLIANLANPKNFDDFGNIAAAAVVISH